MDLHLRGKRVLITGASKGIGAAAAEAFAEEGAHLRLAARSEDQLKALAERLRSAHQIDATAHVVDLRKPEDRARLVKDASDIDILVNNAGDIPGGPIDKIDEATWRHAWELKVFGYINLSRAIYAQMKARGHGVIVNDIGAAGEKFDANYICGSAGNAALMAFTRALGARVWPTTSASSASIPARSAPIGTSRCSRPAPSSSSAMKTATRNFRKAFRSAVPPMPGRSEISWRSSPPIAPAIPRA